MRVRCNRGRMLRTATLLLAVICCISFAVWRPVGSFPILSPSDVFTEGPLLEAVQRLHIFNDSKYFVDMPMKYSVAETLDAFKQLGPAAYEKENLTKFVDDMFFPPGNEMEPAQLTDWIENPPILATIQDRHYRVFASDLNELWHELGRKIKSEVKLSPDKYSLIYVPWPFVIPGGRFREIYYWDSYWICKGLLASKMYVTVRGMIENFAYLVQQFGFIPNGNRIYYLNRSQPPLFIPMVADYFDATGDLQFVNQLLPDMAKEFQFWINRRYFMGDRPGFNSSVRYFRYKVDRHLPRPESWREDTETTKGAEYLSDKQLIWSEIATAAESGWDFSSRWLEPLGPDALKLATIRTSSIIPVDLNAYMALAAKSLSRLYLATGDQQQAVKYQQFFINICASIHEIHWNEADGIWYDYDMVTKTQRRQFYISNVVPLMAGCQRDVSEAKRVLQYLRGVGALTTFPLGIPTSFVNSTQQWDFTNAWPPAVHQLIEGLRLTGDGELVKAAEQIASQWVQTNYDAYMHSHHMFEKYDVDATNHTFMGSGGEYTTQIGFGWTNGVLMDLFTKFPNISHRSA